MIFLFSLSLYSSLNVLVYRVNYFLVVQYFFYIASYSFHDARSFLPLGLRRIFIEMLDENFVTLRTVTRAVTLLKLLHCGVTSPFGFLNPS